MAVEPETLMINIFLASLIIAQFEVALVAAFHTLWLATAQELFKKAIRRSIYAALWFFVLAIGCLGAVTFNDGVLDSIFPKISFVLVILGSGWIAYTMFAAGGWEIVDKISHSYQPKTKTQTEPEAGSRNNSTPDKPN